MMIDGKGCAALLAGLAIGLFALYSMWTVLSGLAA